MFLRFVFSSLLCFFTVFSFKVQALTEVSFVEVAEKVLPSVVSVSSLQTQVEPPEMMLALRGSPFEHFFKDVYKEGGFDTPKSMLLGSGFVYDKNGHIVTNAHVVSDLKEVVVTLNDGRALTAKVIGKDLKTDLAVLKVEEKDLPVVLLGDSDLSKVGEPVLAVGNPFGLGNSVSSGIISARSRDIQVGPYDDFIQTDAAMNKGNSGGPLFNAKAEMIGVNTAIFSPSGGSVGIGFAVPSKLVKIIASALIKNGVVKTGRLGLNVQTVSNSLAKRTGLSEAKGAFVSSLDMNSKAKESEIKQGDIILKFENKAISEISELTRLAGLSEVGRVVSLTVFRKGKTLTLPLEISELKEKNQKALLPTSAIELKNIQSIDFLGIKVSEITQKIRQKYGIEKSLNGLVVVDVESQTDAFDKGLKAGDVIVELDKMVLSSFKDLEHWKEEVAYLGQESSFVLINRKAHRFFAVIRFTQNSSEE